MRTKPIRIHPQVIEDLKELKEYPRETYSDTIEKLIKEKKEQQ